MADSKFDKPFNELRDLKLIKKVADVGGFAFYKITEEGKPKIKHAKK